MNRYTTGWQVNASPQWDAAANISDTPKDISNQIASMLLLCCMLYLWWRVDVTTSEIYFNTSFKRAMTFIVCLADRNSYRFVITFSRINGLSKTDATVHRREGGRGGSKVRFLIKSQTPCLAVWCKGGADSNRIKAQPNLRQLEYFGNIDLNVYGMALVSIDRWMLRECSQIAWSQLGQRCFSETWLWDLVACKQTWLICGFRQWIWHMSLSSSMTSQGQREATPSRCLNKRQTRAKDAPKNERLFQNISNKNLSIYFLLLCVCSVCITAIRLAARPLGA